MSGAACKVSEAKRGSESGAPTFPVLDMQRAAPSVVVELPQDQMQKLVDERGVLLVGKHDHGGARVRVVEPSRHLLLLRVPSPSQGNMPGSSMSRASGIAMLLAPG